MIDVIIPAYNAHSTIENTLYSISIQTIVDKLNVYICNDAGKDYHEYVEFFSKFMKIKELKLKKNGGPGLAREEGLKNSKGTYVIFIDSDDVFADPFSIESLYEKMKISKADVVIGNFNEQSKRGEYKIHKNDHTWLHGKMYRRSFLKKNNIHFNDSRANEDNYFNFSILLRNPKMVYLEKDVYNWLYNPSSITRRNDGSYDYDGIFGYVENMELVLKNGIKEKVPYDNIAALAISVFYAMYYYYICYEKIELAQATKGILDVVVEYPVKDEKKQKELIKNQFLSSYDVLDKDRMENPPIDPMDFARLVKES